MNLAYLLQFCAHFNYPEECKNALVDAFHAIEAVPEVLQAWEAFLEEYRQKGVQTDFMDQPGKMMEGLPSVDAETYTVNMLFFVLNCEHLHELYRQKGLSEEMFDQSCLDLWAKAVECKKVYGYYGNFTVNWPVKFFRLERFAIGRFQYDLEPHWSFTSADGKVSFNDVPKVSVHIPSLGPLHREEMVESFRKAAVFYQDAFPDGYVMFSCNSWLLSAVHREVLSPTSGIVTFMDLFDFILPATWDPVGALWRIFDTKQCDDLDALPQNTTLQKAYIALLKKDATVIPTGVGFKFIRVK